MISVIVEHVMCSVMVKHIHQGDFKGMVPYRTYFLRDLNFANFVNPATIREN